MTVPPAAQIAAALASAAHDVECGFLAAGEHLERAVAILDRLNARFSAHVAELTDARLGAASEGLAAAGQQVTQLADAHARDSQVLARLARIITTIASRVAALAPLTREIDALAWNARVVAAGMGAAGSDFLAFTSSIQAAVQRGRGSLARLGQDIGRAEHNLGAARAGAESFAAQQGSSIRAIPEQLAATHRALAARQALAGEAAATARARAEAIGRKVAEQIAALQLGDITRQRLEHVETGIRLMAETPAAGGLAGEILAAQLQDAAGALAEQGEQIEARLTQLAADAIAIDQLGLDLHADDAEPQDSFMLALQAELQQTAGLFTALRVADADTEQRMQAVLQAASDLAEHLAELQSVEQDIHIVGLNATLKCGRLGSTGRALAVVAQELRACGCRFAGEAAGVLGELDQLRSQAAGLLDPRRQQQHAALARAADSMLAATRELQRVEGELRQGLIELERDAEQVGRLVAAALERFAVREAVVTTMRQSARQLAAGPGTGTGTEQTAAAAALLQRIAATYTMTREREVHARLSPLPAQDAAVSLPCADEILF